MPKTGKLNRVGATFFYMKKLLSIFVLSFATVISSFANDFKTNAPNKWPFTRPWTVSSYGFLIFPTVLDLDEFINLVKSKTHSEIQQYITDSLSGFSSRGSSIYSNSDVTVTESETPDYAMNTYRIIQTEGVVLKPISARECSVNFEFVLAITPAYLNSTTYGYLQSGTYDQYSMNKFATNPDTDAIPIKDYCALTPYGYEETDPNPCPDGGDLPIASRPVYEANTMNIFIIDPVTGIAPRGPFMVQTSSAYEERNPSSYSSGELLFVRRPFWGWGAETCVQDGTWFDPITNQEVPRYRRNQIHYIFWINVGDDPYFAYELQWSTSSSSC